MAATIYLIDSLLMPESCSQELKLKANPFHNLLAVQKTNTIGSVMCCEDFGDLQILLGVTTYAH